MTKEDIIATAIHEAFLCGKEAGEAYQRQYHIMQKKIDDAKQGKPDHDLHMYDGIFSQFPKIRINEESAISPDINEVTFQIETVPSVKESQLTIMELHEIIAMERQELARQQAEIKGLKSDNEELGKILEEKDATITELRSELEHLRATVPVGSPTGKELSPCINYIEGDQVIVSGKFFGDSAVLFKGTILEVMKNHALVLITEKDSDFEDEEHNIPYEYITKV